MLMRTDEIMNMRLNLAIAITQPKGGQESGEYLISARCAYGPIQEKTLQNKVALLVPISYHNVPPVGSRL